MTMFRNDTVYKQYCQRVQQKLNMLPFHINFDIKSQVNVGYWLQAKNENDFITKCVQSEVWQYILNTAPFDKYEISEQLSIANDFCRELQF